MANSYTSSYFERHDIDWSIVLWLVLAIAAITVVAYSFVGPGGPIDQNPAAIEEWVP